MELRSFIMGLTRLNMFDAAVRDDGSKAGDSGVWVLAGIKGWIETWGDETLSDRRAAARRCCAKSIGLRNERRSLSQAPISTRPWASMVSSTMHTLHSSHADEKTGREPRRII